MVGNMDVYFVWRQAYQGYSFEELRLAGGSWGACAASAAARGVTVPAERLAVRAQPDGSYVAAWTPRAPGAYTARCTLDDRPTPRELRIEVVDATEERPPERGGRPGDAAPAPAAAPSRLRRFAGRRSSGLRVRASPSLQAEELGRVPPASDVAFVEEVQPLPPRRRPAAGAAGASPAARPPSGGEQGRHVGAAERRIGARLHGRLRRRGVVPSAPPPPGSRSASAARPAHPSTGTMLSAPTHASPLRSKGKQSNTFANCRVYLHNVI